MQALHDNRRRTGLLSQKLSTPSSSSHAFAPIEGKIVDAIFKIAKRYARAVYRVKSRSASRGVMVKGERRDESHVLTRVGFGIVCIMKFRRDWRCGRMFSNNGALWIVVINNPN